jgi:hypothetical protein
VLKYSKRFNVNWKVHVLIKNDFMDKKGDPEPTRGHNEDNYRATIGHLLEMKANTNYLRLYKDDPRHVQKNKL